MSKPAFIIIAIVIYLLSAGISYALFSNTSIWSIGGTDSTNQATSDTSNDYEALVFDATAKKTEECPLNGEKYSKEQKNWWEKHRPLGIMIENHQESRPQSGLNAADVIYESVAEGGITRYLAVYYCNDAGIVGPVRSARTYFLDYISEYGKYP